MKLIKIVKLARVKYGDLDEGDMFWDFTSHDSPGESAECFPNGACQAEDEFFFPDEEVCPTDTTKYPPEEVTYTIEGIPEDSINKYPGNEDRVFIDDVYAFNESEIETRMI